MVVRESSQGRWREGKCARCGAAFTFMTRGAHKKYCDACAEAVALEKRRAWDKNRKPRTSNAVPRAPRRKVKLIPYAGWEGSR
jgi:hypothetical protein